MSDDPDDLSAFLDGLEERVQSGRPWTPGVVMAGDAKDAGTVLHDGEKISLEQYEGRLEYHRETYGVEGVSTIRLNVVETDAEPFEQEVISPKEKR